MLLFSLSNFALRYKSETQFIFKPSSGLVDRFKIRNCPRSLNTSFQWFVNYLHIRGLRREYKIKNISISFILIEHIDLFLVSF
jgi:hypothetical protein